MSYCYVIPKVKAKISNELKLSKLFSNLLFLTKNREATLRFYVATYQDKFKQAYPNFKDYLDENGEVSIYYLLHIPAFKEMFSYKYLEGLLPGLSKKFWGTEKDGSIRTTANVDAVAGASLAFNIRNEYRPWFSAKVAHIAPKTDERVKHYLSFEVKQNMFSLEDLSNETANKNLNKFIREFLLLKGVSIGAITKLEEDLKANGVFDTSKMSEELATGLKELIRLAKGEQGEKALPEEFSHFIIETLLNDPIMKRLLNDLAENEGALREILGDSFDDYNKLYKGSKLLLAKEAAGKLLTKHLLRNEEIGSSAWYKKLLTRVIDWFKSKFSKWNTSEIDDIIDRSDKELLTLASEIRKGDVNNKIELKSISGESIQLYQKAKENIEKDLTLLQRIQKKEAKTLNLYKDKKAQQKLDQKDVDLNPFEETQNRIIGELEHSIKANDEVGGVYSYLENVLSRIGQLQKELNDLYADDMLKKSPNNAALTLRNIYSFLESYNPIIDDLYEELNKSKRGDNLFANKVEARLSEIKHLISNMASDFNTLGKPLWLKIVEGVVGKSLVVGIGKDKGKVYTPETIMARAEHDISFFDRWLNAMGKSQDMLLKVFDNLVKETKGKARLRTLDIVKRLQAAQLILENKGIKTLDWIFERDNKGKPTGNYVREADVPAYYKAEHIFKNYLDKKYGNYEDMMPGDDIDRDNELTNWYKENAISDGYVRTPNPNKFPSAAFKSLNAAQREYYRFLLGGPDKDGNIIDGIKVELDSLLPDGIADKYSAIQIRKDFLERLKHSEKGIAKESTEALADLFLRREDDTEYGNRKTKNEVLDLQGEPVESLPIYYITKLEDPTVISEDVTSTMAAYASMAIDFNEMKNVIEILELGRDFARDREVVQHEGGLIKREVFKALGKDYSTEVTKKGNDTYIMQRLNDFFKMQVYGKYIADQGSVLNTSLDVAKMANNINAVTALNNLALNTLSSISNVTTGNVMMHIEMVTNQFFNPKDVAKADGIYAKELAGLIAELGNRVKMNKLSLFNELFNVQGDERIENMDRKTWASIFAKFDTLFFLSNSGEHWMHSRTGLSVAMRYNMKDSSGKIVNLWDAFEVENNMVDGVKVGARLKIKEGYTKEDGSEFTQKDIIDLSLKITEINNSMHGIYNKADMNAFQRLAQGRMVIIFRKWMVPNYNKRYASTNYNFDTKTWTEGYYKTAWNFLGNVFREKKQLQFELTANWDKLNDLEKKNMYRTMMEIGHLLTLFGILALFLALKGDDPDRPWLSSMAEYQIRRLMLELGAMTPSPGMFSNIFTIMQSPAAGVDYVQKMFDIFKFTTYFEVLQSGRYEGHTKMFKYWMELVPLQRNIYKAINPEESMKFLIPK